MFENLPVISRADLNVWRDESLPYFGTVVERCVKETGVGFGGNILYVWATF